MLLNPLLGCYLDLGLLISWRCKTGRTRGTRWKWGIITLQGEGGWLGWELLGADMQVQMDGYGRQGRGMKDAFLKHLPPSLPLLYNLFL